MKLVHKPGVAAKPLVALPHPIVGFLCGPFLLREESEPALTVLVEIRGCLLHGGQLARPLLFGLLPVCIAAVRSLGVRSRRGPVAAIVVIPARRIRAAVVAVPIGVLVLSP